MRHQEPRLLVMRRRSVRHTYRTSMSFLILLSCLIVAGSVNAAFQSQAEHSGDVSANDAAPLFDQMLKHALVAYVNGKHEQAYVRLLPLAQKNDVDAQYFLATLYDGGHGVELSPAMASYWYKRAAKLGHVNAQYNMGVAYANGDGVRQSIIEAVRWWRMAAISGSINAQFNLGIMYLRGEGIRHDPTEAVRWWGKAAEQGDAAAQYNLGALYASGEGVSRNVKVALSWWARAAAQGFEQAIVALRVHQFPEQLSNP